MNKQSAQFIPTQTQMKKYGPAAAGLAGGAALGGATGGWGGALGLGALAGGLGLAYGLTPGKDFGEKWNTIKGYWNKFQNGGFGSLAEQWAAKNPDTVKNIAGNWMKNNPEAAKQMAFQYMRDNPEARKQLTGVAAAGLHKAVQGKGWLARTFGPSQEEIHKGVDDEAVRMIGNATQVKQGSLAEAFCKEATPLGVSALSPRLATVWNKIAPDSLTVPDGENQPAPLPHQAPAQPKVEPVVKGWPVPDPTPYTAPAGPQQRFDPHPVREGRFDYWGKSMVPRR